MKFQYLENEPSLFCFNIFPLPSVNTSDKPNLDLNLLPLLNNLAISKSHSFVAEYLILGIINYNIYNLNSFRFKK